MTTPGLKIGDLVRLSRLGTESLRPGTWRLNMPAGIRVWWLKPADDAARCMGARDIVSHERSMVPTASARLRAARRRHR